MNTREVTLVPAPQAKSGCGCGGTPATGTCCRLDCLQRPRFYCGQLLTDRDLTGLVDWSLDKLRLGRFRHGWGVVCGLDVRCDPNAKGRARVIVGPGYAVSCCGDDIVVCEETVFDLGDVCAPPRDPCPELRRPDADAGQEGEPEKARPIPFDVLVHYDEQPAEPRAAFARAACREVAVCEPIRTREGFRLSVRRVTRDPVKEAADRWDKRYAECRSVVDRFHAWRKSPLAGQKRTVRDMQLWLLEWIEAHPLRHFCFVRDRICGLPPNQDPDKAIEAMIAEILFFLVQDCRNTLLQRPCFECDAEDDGVPLARVWVLPVEHGEQRCCRVQTIDPYPPHRRPLSLPSLPAPDGSVNLGGAVWRPWPDARSYLRGFDVTVAAHRDIKAENTTALLDAVVVVKAGSKVTSLVLDQPDADGVLGARVVGFKV